MAQKPSLDFSTILASSVHDMKNSISMLLATLDELATSCGHTCPESAKLSQLRYQGQRLNNDLVQMLSIYKIENKQFTPNIDEHSMEEFLAECVDPHEPLLKARGISIESTCPKGLIGFFDREMVLGVVNNVINNAYKYSKDRIRLEASTLDGFVAIQISDNGSGYPPGMLHENGRDARPTNFRTGSTSLGLYFAALIADLHTNRDNRGYIELTNQGMNGGGRFTIYLP